MNYTIHITNTAQRDILNAADYIEFVLKNPEAADNLLDHAEHTINNLTNFPETFPFVDDPVLSSWGIRFVTINNYLAFYIVDDEKQKIIVVRFLYGKSDWNAILHQGLPLI